MPEKLWVSQDGRMQRVGQMDEAHLDNAIAMVERDRFRVGWLPRLYMEKAARACPIVTPFNINKLAGQMLAQLITRGLVDKPDSAAPVPSLSSNGSKTVRSRSVRRGAGSSTPSATRPSGTRSGTVRRVKKGRKPK